MPALCRLYDPKNVIDTKKGSILAMNIRLPGVT
jgi:hypothetical protein